VAYADRVLRLDPDSGDLDLEVIMPWPDEVSSVTRLAAAGTDLMIAADLASGGSRLYRYGSERLRAVCDHTDSLSALATLGNYVYGGDNQGRLLRLGTSAWDVQYETEQDLVLCLGLNGATLFAGTGSEGQIYSSVSGWGPNADMGWDEVRAAVSFNGWMYAGGSGAGGQYLWFEQAARSWAQAIELDDATAVNDLVVVAGANGQQLYAATTGDGSASALWRVEIADAGELVLPAEWFAEDAPMRQYGFGVIA
jgi:hypothetical protein